MLLFSTEMPNEEDRNDLFLRTTNKMIEKKIIVLEDNVIRLFKNAKANRIIPREHKKKPNVLRRGWWPGQPDSDEEDKQEVLS